MTGTVAEVMTRCPVSIRPGAPFATVAAMLARNRISAVPVVDRDGLLIGVGSEADLVGGPGGAGSTARESMTAPVRTVDRDTTLPTAALLLAEAGIPTVRSIMAEDTDSALAILRELGGPVALKVVAAGGPHKARAGGVVLNVATEQELRAATARFRERFGDAVRSVLLQPMAAPGRELVVGVDSDETFGPLVVFGLGGTDTDLVADRVTRLTPVSEVDAKRMLAGVRSSAALFGGDTSLPTGGLVDILTRVRMLAEAVPEVAGLDLNPVVARADGRQVLDARVRFVPREPADPLLRRLRA